MSNIRRYVDSALARRHKEDTKDVIRDGVESGGTGFLLGLISAKRAGGLDVGKAPIDLGIGVVGLAGSVFAPLSAAGREMIRQVSGTALGIGVFRKTEHHFKAAATTAHGEIEEGVYQANMGAEDPIVAAARNL